MFGVIEGFYGTPYSFEQRLDLLRFLPRAGLNTYVYAPKNDPYSRDRWRDPYPADFLQHFAELASTGRSEGVRFVFALSPGADFDPDGGDFDAMREKLGTLVDAGVRDFCLLFDDLTPQSRAADPQVEVRIVSEAFTFLRGVVPDGRLCFISHFYAGSADELRADQSPFDLGFAVHSSAAYAAYQALPPDVAILWTGRRVFSDPLTVADTNDFQAFVDRPVVVWDNFPVNDTLPHELFLSPYRDREAGIAGVAGVLLNPMLQPEASKIPLWTAGRFFAEGASYDPDAALDDALAVVAGSPAGAEVVARIAAQFRSHPLIGNERESPDLTDRAAAFFDSRSAESEAALRALLQSYAATADDLEHEVPNPELVDELREPAQKLSLYGAAGALALDGLDAQARGEPFDAGALNDLLSQAAAIPWLVGANTPIGSGLGQFLAGHAAVRADAFGDFFGRLRDELNGGG
jgi:hyaluronoglucosaminidase